MKTESNRFVPWFFMFFCPLIIASLLPAGTVSLLYYADRVQQLPLGVIGTAVGTAVSCRY